MNFENIFINDDEYQSKKDEKTSSAKPETAQSATEKLIVKMLEGGMTQMEVAKITGKSRSNISYIKQKLTTG